MRQLPALALTLALGLISTSAAPAQEPVRLVMPFAAGSSTDALARVIAHELQSELGRNVVVENKTGAAGRLGVQTVRNAAPDGATLLFSPIAPMAVYQQDEQAFQPKWCNSSPMFGIGTVPTIWE